MGGIIRCLDCAVKEDQCAMCLRVENDQDSLHAARAMQGDEIDRYLDRLQEAHEERDALKARVAELEVENATAKRLVMRLADPQSSIPELLADRNAALDALHALAGWVDAVKGILRVAIKEKAVDDRFKIDAEMILAQRACVLLLERLEGGWDAEGRV